MNLENFWNELYQKYPSAIAHFSEWVDDYKIQHNWSDLFPPIIRKHYPIHVKFHDLPVGFQLGVIIQYMNESDKDQELFIMLTKERFISKLMAFELPDIAEKLTECQDCMNKKACQSFGCEKQLGFNHKNPM